MTVNYLKANLFGLICAIQNKAKSKEELKKKQNMTWRYHELQRIFFYNCFAFQKISNELLGHLKTLHLKKSMIPFFHYQHRTLKLLKTNQKLSSQNFQSYNKFLLWDPTD